MNISREEDIIVCFGELLWDQFTKENLVLGGAPANVAFRLQSLSNGKKISIISKVGNDSLGKKAIEQLSKNKVCTKYIQSDTNNDTGIVKIIKDVNTGDCDYSIVPLKAYDFIEYSDSLKNIMSRCSLFYFGTLIQRNEQSRKTLYKLLESNSECKKFLDVNLRNNCYSSETIRKSLHSADIVKLNNEEVTVLNILLNNNFNESTQLNFNEWCSNICQEFSIESILITCGGQGVFAYTNGNDYFIPGYIVDVKDTVGSGDAFSAAFILKYLETNNIVESCKYGNKLGALVAQTSGGMSPIDEQQIQNFSAPQVENIIFT